MLNMQYLFSVPLPCTQTASWIVHLVAKLLRQDHITRHLLTNNGDPILLLGEKPTFIRVSHYLVCTFYIDIEKCYVYSCIFPISLIYFSFIVLSLKFYFIFLFFS